MVTMCAYRAFDSCLESTGRGSRLFLGRPSTWLRGSGHLRGKTKGRWFLAGKHTAHHVAVSLRPIRNPRHRRRECLRLTGVGSFFRFHRRQRCVFQPGGKTMQTRLFCMIKYRDLFHFLKIFLSVVAMVVLTGEASLAAQPGKKASSGACRLNAEKGNIEHVIFLIFDNVHFLRDNPNVPSDLEQMPNLLNFIRGNGTLLTNNHTVLISHTANGI